MLSILIPTYDTAVVSLVKELIKQSQNLEAPIEIIVLDDASPSREILQENKILNQLEHTTYIVSKENLGRTAARKVLADKASYPLLLFLDADVIPKYPTFLDRYLPYLKNPIPLVVGGIDYPNEKPPKEQMLRYRYGKKRERKSVEKRNKNPHIIVSANLLFQKEIFLEINRDTQNRYGLDLLLSEKIKQLNIPVKHIDNPVYHLGLEPSKDFILKSKKALQTLVDLETKNEISNVAYPIQSAYQSLKKYKLLAIFTKGMKLFDASIQRNLQSASPSIFLFNLYRLHQYALLKKDVHA